MSLADAWWDLAQQADAKSKDGMLLRAGYWYRQAVDTLDSDVLRLKIGKRLDGIAKLGRAIPEAPGERVLTNSLGMKFVQIPAGEFMMGSTPEEIVRYAEDGKKHNETQWYFDHLQAEAPKHRVRISRSFYLGMYLVTQAEYEQVMGVNPSSFSAKGKDAAKVSGNDASRHPVETVSWDDAAQFCQRLSALPKERSARRAYRLPTEAEWEYACRAGSTGQWTCGDDEAKLGEYAWCKDNAGGMTHPADEKKPNAWGLYDMHGSLWEWCLDWYDKDYYRRSPGIDPVGPPSGSERVNRGGTWRNTAWYARSAFRSSNGPGARYPYVGLRVLAVRADGGSR